VQIVDATKMKQSRLGASLFDSRFIKFSTNQLAASRMSSL
jgi:hypothetical protein